MPLMLWYIITAEEIVTKVHGLTRGGGGRSDTMGGSPSGAYFGFYLEKHSKARPIWKR